MDLANYCVHAVLEEGRSVRAVAQATGTSKSWVHRHVQLYRGGGEAALEPQRRGPKRPPALTAPEVEDTIVWWRKHLSDAGFDAGARTIHYHLSQSMAPVPALSTIHRVLRRRGLVVDQPQKRPRSSWIRFCADFPNECWQTDMTHWHARGEKVGPYLMATDWQIRAAGRHGLVHRPGEGQPIETATSAASGKASAMVKASERAA